MTHRFHCPRNAPLSTARRGGVRLAVAGLLVVAPAALAQYGVGTNPGGGGVSNATIAKNANLAAARGDLDRAMSAMTSARTKVQANWKSNPQYVEADDKLTAARKDFEAARRAVVDRLKDDPAYKKLLDSKADAQSDLTAAREKQAATQPAAAVPGDSVQTAAAKPQIDAKTLQAATDKLEAKTQLRNLEDKAVANDPNASKAQAKFNEAEKEAKVWKLQLDAALRNDPDFKAALDSAQAARQRLAAAGAAVPDFNY